MVYMRIASSIPILRCGKELTADWTPNFQSGPVTGASEPPETWTCIFLACFSGIWAAILPLPTASLIRGAMISIRAGCTVMPMPCRAIFRMARGVTKSPWTT